MEGSGVYMFRNLFNRPGQTQPRKLANVEIKKPVVAVEEKADKSADVLSSMATAMASSRNMEARRRLSQTARANLPVLVDA